MKAAQNLLLLTRRAQLHNKVVAPRVVGHFRGSYLCHPKGLHIPSYSFRSLHITSEKSNEGVATTSSTDVPAFADVPGVQTSGEKMIIMYTCTVCDTRSARKISKQAYYEGIVMVRCDCCKNRHLIADRMGVFEDSIEGKGWDIQAFLQKQEGIQAKKITDENVFELSMEDILGAKAAAMVNQGGDIAAGVADNASKTNK